MREGLWSPDDNPVVGGKVVSAQTIAEMQARYPDAVRDVYDAEAMALGTCAYPGERPEHVFRFEDGVVMVVNRTRADDGEVFTHFSASYLNRSDIQRWLTKETRTEIDVLGRIVLHWTEIRPEMEPCKVKFIGWADDGRVAHFAATDEERLQL